MRMLCLHGFGGTGAQLRTLVDPLLRDIALPLEALYVDAPEAKGRGYCWWDAVPTASTDERARHYEGWPRTLDWARDYCAQHAPIDGIFGFSQGACAGALLVGSALPFAFAILVGGFVSNDPDHRTLYDELTIPSLHVMGRADRVVPGAASLALAARFRDPVVLEHDGGHTVPRDPETLRAIGAFLSLQAKHRSKT